MGVNLLKRLESSIHSFRLTLTRIYSLMQDMIAVLNVYETAGSQRVDMFDYTFGADLDMDDQNTDFFTVGRKVKIDLDDMDWMSWRAALWEDINVLERLLSAIKDITPEHDSKLMELYSLVSDKIEHPINAGNRKVIIFSAFADTAEYLYENVSAFIKKKYGLETALVTGTGEGRTTLASLARRTTLNNILTCISEGQNLQDCDYLVNYDIHWNPVRIIQRFGRIDRIGSRNKEIQLVNFWPDISLDEYIDLKARVETRMKISVMTSTGDDDLLDPDEKGDLEYRRQQLLRLQEEVVDIEDMSSGISILDLGLNEFRIDLLDYVKRHGDIDKLPCGLHAVVPASDNMPAGVIFVLKNRNNGVNIDNLNHLHPFYMVYVSRGGEVVCDYLDPKKLLNMMRLLCRGCSEPIREAYAPFNTRTDDGRDMTEVSRLLTDAINSIIDTKEESDIDSLFTPGGTSALNTQISGLDDFELITFLVIE